MKQIITFLIVPLLMSAMSYAQVNFMFTSRSETFSKITGTAFTSWYGTTPSDEGFTAPTYIGFTFNYAGTAFNEFQVSSNGFLRLGSGLMQPTPFDELSGPLRSVIAPLWDDLQVSATSDITYQLTGSSGNRVLTVQWLNVKWNKYASTSNAEFQIKLHESYPIIEFFYGNMGTPYATGSASIGLADNTAIYSTNNHTTGKFLSINVGGSSGSRVYHLSRGYTFNGIQNAPDSNTKFRFTSVTPSAIAGGTYTVGGSSPDFATLSEAANFLNIDGISGPVTLNVRAGTYDDIFHLINVSGTSASNTITLKNESGTVTLAPRNGSGVNASGGPTYSDAIIRLDGTQYTVIDGLTLNDNGQGSPLLKFAVGIMLGNSVNPNGTMLTGGRFNTFKNLTIDMKPTTGASHPGAIGIRYFTTSTSETDSSKSTSYNIIENCNFTGFWKAAWSNYGISGTNPDNGNIMRGCTLGNFSITGGSSSNMRALEMDSQKDLLIENNIIENINVSIMTTHSIYGISLNPASSTTNLNSGTIIIRGNTIRNLENSGSGVTSGYAVGISSNNVANNTEIQVYDNKIYDIFTNGSTTSRMLGINIFTTTGTPTTVKIYNNMVSDLRAPRSTSTPGVRGIDIQNAGTNGSFIVYNNSILLNDDVPPTYSGHQSAGIIWANFSTATLDLRNNIIINSMNTSSGKAACLFPTSNYLRLASTTDHNLYYSGASPSSNQGISWDGTTLIQTLSAHQAAIATGGLGGPRDVNAKSAAVTFASVSDLHLSGGSVGDITNLIGQALSSPYNVDIDEDARDVIFPYIGADEVPSSPLPVQLSAFTATVNGLYPELRWTTATEIDNHGFEIERASNGMWKNICFVEGAGNSNAPKSYTYIDAGARGTVSYRLKQIDRDGSFEYSSVVEATVPMTAADFSLAQNYPNPFNPTTKISFEMPMQTKVTVKVFNTLGQTVATVFDGIAAMGLNEATFDASNLPSGIYFYSLTSNHFAETKKMMLMK